MDRIHKTPVRFRKHLSKQEYSRFAIDNTPVLTADRTRPAVHNTFYRFARLPFVNASENQCVPPGSSLHTSCVRRSSIPGRRARENESVFFVKRVEGKGYRAMHILRWQQVHYKKGYV